MDKSVDKVAREVQEDLEFLQLLSNPHYVEFLISHKFFENEAFVNYLRYLSYISQSELVSLVKYPVSLRMLRNLQDPDFICPWIDNWKERNERPTGKDARNLEAPPVSFADFISAQLFYHSVALTEEKSKVGTGEGHSKEEVLPN
jgi:mediator of RNA polymerase II transcription subunit 31